MARKANQVVITTLDHVNITEVELAMYSVNKAKLTELRAEVKKLERSLEAQEAGFIKRIQNGVKVIGRIKAAIEWRNPPCRPAWKEHFLELAERFGLNPKQEEDRVISDTENNLTPNPHLAITIPAEVDVNN